MSHVTNIIIAGYFDNKDHEIISEHLAKITKGTINFMSIDPDSVGGDKWLESDLYIAAINHLDVTMFIGEIRSLEHHLSKWTFDNLQIFIKNQDDNLWKIYLASELEEKHFY